MATDDLPREAVHSDLPGLVLELADAIERGLPAEAKTAEPGILKRALLTLAHQIQPAPISHACKRLRSY